MSQKYLPAARSRQIAAFLEKGAKRGHVIFALDATASRQSTWDRACTLQAEMFAEAAKIGGLEIQLVYYRGFDECEPFGWTSNARELTDRMSRISCMVGETQIARVLAHIREEHAVRPVDAAIFIGDAVEEEPHSLYNAAARLNAPLFAFQEGADSEVEKVFREMARLTKPQGAYAKFTTGAAGELAELLCAVAAFSVGGRTALANLRTDSARKLFGQLK
jgi:hypothetical protein